MTQEIPGVNVLPGTVLQPCHTQVIIRPVGSCSDCYKLENFFVTIYVIFKEGKTLRTARVVATKSQNRMAQSHTSSIPGLNITVSVGRNKNPIHRTSSILFLPWNHDSVASSFIRIKIFQKDYLSYIFPI